MPLEKFRSLEEMSAARIRLRAHNLWTDTKYYDSLSVSFLHNAKKFRSAKKLNQRTFF
jgi:hypothetical protein